MKLYTVGVLGATGAVGQEMMNLLEERNFPVGKLVPLASARSAGKTLKFRGEDVVIQEACDSAFEGIDIVLGAAENDIAEKFAPAIVKAGAVFVDNSSAFRLDPNVPLVVPEVNPEDAKLHKGIISNPNCSTIITVTAVNALNKLSPIKSMVASTYQAVSGAGVNGMAELKNQLEALMKAVSAASFWLAKSTLPSPRMLRVPLAISMGLRKVTLLPLRCRQKLVPPSRRRKYSALPVVILSCAK